MQQQIHFIVTNDPEHDFDLMLEAYKGDELIADVRDVDDNWIVRFFVEHSLYETSWQDLAKVYEAFSKFIAEMTTSSESR